jgi:signal transduction histidine kinase
MEYGSKADDPRRGEARILAVDDTPANLMALCALLEPMGHEIVMASSGRRALACAAQSEFALVLLDVMMPGMDGFETLSRLRQLPKFDGTPVLLLTAYEPQPRMVEHAYAMGAADYVFKPIAPDVLRAKVEVFVSLYRRGLELRRRGEALATKDRYIAILAHDLRAPLTTIGVTAQSLARREPSPRTQEQAGRIFKAAHRMDRMVEDLLNFARVGAGGLPIVRTEVDLAAVIREAIDELGTVHPDRPIDLDIDGSLRGLWDRERLQQMLSNLIVNAIKYGVGRIAVRAHRLGSQVELAVWNDGDPIPEGRIGRIFEPFERGQEGGTGLGLGLYVVTEIVRAHGGNVSVSSSREGGTTFSLTMPLGMAAIHAAEEARP